MGVSFINFTCKKFIFQNISSCKSTIFHPHTIPDNVFDGSSRNLTPRHTTRDAFISSLKLYAFFLET